MNINKDDFPDVMVDIETTGTDSASCAIIQIAAVRFNLQARTVSPDFFDRCLMIPTTRFWQEGGRDFWVKRKELFHSISARMEDPETVMRALIEWCGGQRVLWAKPSHFEFPFLESYFRRYELQTPFFYRSVNDQNSFFRGLYYPATVPDFERSLPFVGELHNGLYDTLHQLKVLFHTVEDAMAQRNAVLGAVGEIVGEMKQVLDTVGDGPDNPATGAA
jgi:DNA polymerase III epsilon subunit-like protein